MVVLKPVQKSETEMKTKEERKQSEELSLQIEASLPVNEKLSCAQRKSNESNLFAQLKRDTDVKELNAAFPGIPDSVLRRIRGESETTVDVAQTIRAGFPERRSFSGKNSTDDASASGLSTPTASLTDLSERDAAHLLKHQQKTAKSRRSDVSTHF